MLQIYDGEGNLIVFFKGIFTIAGANTDTCALGAPEWQPLAAPADIPSPVSTSHQALAATLLDAALALKQSSTGPVVLRVLDIVEREMPCLAEAVSRLKMPVDGVTVEFWMAAHQTSTLTALASGVLRAATWVKIRRVSLGLGASIGGIHRALVSACLAVRPRRLALLDLQLNILTLSLYPLLSPGLAPQSREPHP